jgi:radical SAM protein with 4Fe4S-binding SPASM domain
MDCKFITNGIAIGYDGIVKPCCVFDVDEKWRKNNKLNDIDLNLWHQQKSVIKIKSDLKNNIFPKECKRCEIPELENRGDSMRLNSISAYSKYSDTDITLEIRPGSTCNFACQTCWPQASSRVRQYYNSANIPFENENVKLLNYEKLLPIIHRLKNIVILGGEPFYDKECKKFLSWLKDNRVSANLVMFTNGSFVDKDFLTNYNGKITIVFSLDSIGKSAEYIRFGTEWDTVIENYEWTKKLSNVETRVNITTSPYNYIYLPSLIRWLMIDWPSVVSFGFATTSKIHFYMDESSINNKSRNMMIEEYKKLINELQESSIPLDQIQNTCGVLNSIIDNLSNKLYNENNNKLLKEFIQKMDSVKGISFKEYCPEFYSTIE